MSTCDERGEKIVVPRGGSLLGDLARTYIDRAGADERPSARGGRQRAQAHPRSRAVRRLLALAGHSVFDLSHQDIALGLGLHRGIISREMRTVADELRALGSELGIDAPWPGGESLAEAG